MFLEDQNNGYSLSMAIRDIGKKLVLSRTMNESTTQNLMVFIDQHCLKIQRVFFFIINDIPKAYNKTNKLKNLSCPQRRHKI